MKTRPTTTRAQASAPAEKYQVARQRPIAPLTCIDVAALPLRGLTPAEQKQLAQRLLDHFDAHEWRWSGGQFAGAVVGVDDFALDDLVDLLAWLLDDPHVAQVELSPPRAEDGEAAARLRVHSGCKEAVALCDLYRQRLIDARTVVHALGGFTVRQPIP